MRRLRTCRTVLALGLLAGALAGAGCVHDDAVPAITGVGAPGAVRRLVPPPPPSGHPGAPADESGTLSPADREGFDVVPDNQVRESGQYYRVRAGDTLASIARQFYGEQWERGAQAIYDANRSTVTNPHRLLVGMELRLP